MDKTKWKLVEKNIWKSLEDSHKYKVILYYGRDSKGRMKKSSKVVYGTLSDARNILKLSDSDRIKGVSNIPTSVTMEQLIADWNTNVGDPNTALTTQTSNKNIQKHIITFMGDKKLKNVNASLIEEYYVYLREEKGLSNNTVKKHYTHLHTLFVYMLKHPDKYGIYINPIEYVDTIKTKKYRASFYEPEEAKELLLSLRNSNRHDLEIAVNIAFWCGCRREETCALKWDKVDLDKGVITICEVRTTAQGKVIEADITKNQRDRKIGIPEWFKKILIEEKEHQCKMKKFFGNEYQDNNFVFCHDNGRPWHPNSVSNEFGKYLVNNGFRKIRYHDLRHTNVTLLLSELNPVDVAALAGHQQVSTTTDIYAHAMSTATKKGAETIDSIMDME